MQESFPDGVDAKFAGAPRPKTPLHLIRIRPNNGSAQHYYHFLFGFLFPLCLHLESLVGGRLPRMLVRSCGPLDAILRELAIPELAICPKPDFAAASERFRADLAIERIDLAGFDLSARRPEYDCERMTRAAAAVAARLRSRIAAEAAELAGWGPTRLLVIERGKPDPFYSSPESDRPHAGAGASRRTISNHAELVAALTAHFPSCRNVQLENMPLARQIALFRAADIVVAQHGAALSNVVWMRPGRAVVEIGRWGRLDHFGKLSTAFRVRHRRAPQARARGPVPVPDILRIASVLADGG
jgi:hypothetical protein